MPDQSYWNTVLQNIADIRIWLSEVEARIPREALGPAKPVVPTMSVDEEVAAADSPTRVQKALERELGVDRRTVYQRVETLVEAFQLDRQTPDWRANLGFWKRMAERAPDGKLRMQHGLDTLAAKRNGKVGAA